MQGTRGVGGALFYDAGKGLGMGVLKPFGSRGGL
jgi:hypothetical protein